MTNNCRAQPPSILGSDRLREENPCMSTIARARDFQSHGHIQLAAGLGETSHVLTPIGLVKIHSKKMTRVVG